jgi:ABC-type sugar transport system ATPase subunit
MSKHVLLKVSNLTKNFPGVLALDKVNFKLEAGTVHAVCGENGAGKSTLMNILMGLYGRDEGEILLDGDSVHFTLPKQALDAGISIIEQELNPIPDMTVAENLFLGRESLKLGVFIDYPDLLKRAEKLLEQIGVSMDVSKKMMQLSLAEIQLVEIAKAISYDSKIIIMDEPTSAIGEKDVELLFNVIRSLKEKGKGVIYVSHRLNEIFQISDTITVLRDGRLIGSLITINTNRGELINMMIGRKLEDEYIKTNTPTDEPALAVSNFSRTGEFEDINLILRKGEILGIFGLMGSGRSEFFHALFGVEKISSGTVSVFGEQKILKRPAHAMASGLALVTEDRKNSGLVLTSSVRENISLSNLKDLSGTLFINRVKELEQIDSYINKFQVKITTVNQLVNTLSGGNQQKIVLSKWLMTKPRILLLDEPTRGIDVGAKREIYKFMSDFADQGNAVIMISSELPEVLSMSDRIVVFRQGKISGELSKEEASQDKLMHLAS